MWFFGLWASFMSLIGIKSHANSQIVWAVFVSNLIGSLFKHMIYFLIAFVIGIFIADRWANTKGGLRLISIQKPSNEYGVILGTLTFSEQTIKDVERRMIEHQKTNKNFQWSISTIIAGVLPEISTRGSDLHMRTLSQENAERLHTSHSFIMIIKGEWPVNILKLLDGIPTILSIKGASNEKGSAIILRTRKYPWTRFLFFKKNPKNHIVSLVGYQDGENFEHMGY